MSKFERYDTVFVGYGEEQAEYIQPVTINGTEEDHIVILDGQYRLFNTGNVKTEKETGRFKRQLKIQRTIEALEARQAELVKMIQDKAIETMESRMRINTAFDSDSSSAGWVLEHLLPKFKEVIEKTTLDDMEKILNPDDKDLPE